MTLGIDEFFQGELITIEGSMVADPDSTQLEIERPDRTITTYLWPTGTPALVRDSAGVFHADIDLAEPGPWKWRWTSTGEQNANQGEFTVLPRNVPAS